MEVILTQRCKSLTGTIGSRFGYYIRSTKTGRFFSQRSRYNVPPDGHWRFIWTCAELTKINLHIADIRVPREEIVKAFKEAGYTKPHYELVKFADDYPETFSAKDVLNLKTTFGL